MARQLEDLVGERFSTMSYQEKLNFIRQVRQSRKTLKATSKRAKAAKKERVKAKEKVEDLFDAMTPEEQAALLRRLTNENGV